MNFNRTVTALGPLTCCNVHCAALLSMKVYDLWEVSNSWASEVRSLPFSMLLVSFSALHATVPRLFPANRLLLYVVSVQPALGGMRKKGRRRKQSLYSGLCSRAKPSHTSGGYSYAIWLDLIPAENHGPTPEETQMTTEETRRAHADQVSSLSSETNSVFMTPENYSKKHTNTNYHTKKHNNTKDVENGEERGDWLKRKTTIAMTKPNKQLQN